MKKVHATAPMQVWVDVDMGIAAMVRRINTIRGARTHASCQGETDGPYPYRAYVMVTWKDDDARRQIARLYDLTNPESESGDIAQWTWAYAHPPATALADAIEEAV